MGKVLTGPTANPFDKTPSTPLPAARSSNGRDPLRYIIVGRNISVPTIPIVVVVVAMAKDFYRGRSARRFPQYKWDGIVAVCFFGFRFEVNRTDLWERSNAKNISCKCSNKLRRNSSRVTLILPSILFGMEAACTGPANHFG